MPRLASRAELARLGGRSRAAVTKACAGPLKAACAGDRIDLDHPSVVAWLKRSQAAQANDPQPDVVGSDEGPTKPARAPRKRTPAPTAPSPTPQKAPEPAPEPGPPPAPSVPAPPAPDSRQELDAYSELLRPLLAKFGTARNFKDWLSSLKELEVIREKMLANEVKEGRYIAETLVRTHVMGALEAMNRQLLGDAAKTITRRNYSSARGGIELERAEAETREILSTHLKHVRTTVVRLLRGQDGK